jgi:hypothetical protein
VLGYARVSAQAQDLEPQLRQLADGITPDCRVKAQANEGRIYNKESPTIRGSPVQPIPPLNGAHVRQQTVARNV